MGLAKVAPRLSLDRHILARLPASKPLEGLERRKTQEREPVDWELECSLVWLLYGRVMYADDFAVRHGTISGNTQPKQCRPSELRTLRANDRFAGLYACGTLG